MPKTSKKMNRIYQGRVSNVEIQNPDEDQRKDKPWVTLSKTEGESDLWYHHEVFQDAVNYYLVALGALADSGSDNRVIRDFRQRLQDSWGVFPSGIKDALSLRDSIRRTMPELASDSSLEDAFDLILDGNDAIPDARMLSLSLLLAKCSGDAAIQQGGRGYFPRFCDPDCSPTWDFSPSALQSSSGAARLAEVLHSDATQEQLEAIATEMDLSWTIKLQPDKFFQGDEAKGRLKEAISHLLKLADSPSPRLAEAFAGFAEDPKEKLMACLGAIPGLPDELRIPRNRKAAPDLTFATIAFKYFPCEVTQQFLKLGVKAPKVTPKASAQDANITNFAALGDDPIKLARGERGYVFPAFTALPMWSPESSGLPVWKEFDIAAFKEALKALNQFNQKTIEREGKLVISKQTLDYITGVSNELPVSFNGEGESARILRLGILVWEKIQKLEKELSENLNEGGWRLSAKSLRGFRDIVELWKKEPSATPERLQQIVKNYQADEKNRREIGSVQLFLLLSETRYHDLWKNHAAEGDDEEIEAPASILSAAVHAHRLEDEVERFRQPIRLTPAESTYSRRLCMFSDLKDKLAKVKFGETVDSASGEKRPFIEAAVACRSGKMLRETRVRIHFSAPRLNRDELAGGTESRWLQPMTAALGLTPPKENGAFDSACALMPERLGDGSIRHLLNFPVSLEPAWIHEALGKAAIWKNQFNGTKDDNFHLHWPSTAKEATKKNPWWKNPHLIQNGFTLLSNDLGQRSAGAWSLIQVTPWKPDTKRPVHSIGHDGTREWFAEVLKTGMHRLPGEEQKVLVDGKWTLENSGKTGRSANEAEYAAACSLAGRLGCESIEGWLGQFGDRSFPELNDQLTKIANRRLARLGTYHRWSCFDPERPEVANRRQTIIDSQIAELEAYKDMEVRSWIELLKDHKFAMFRNRASLAFENLRHDLELHLTALANLTVPLRQKTWHWVERGNGTPYGDLLQKESPEISQKIRGQRGLSMVRLEQLEDLRRLFLRYNRALDRNAGEPAKFGRNDTGRASGEPCQLLLDKIKRMKEQRVNQTAHLILAQALGVRLRPHERSANERRDADIHGEYEKIPGRRPVDFIVIEDLSRYLSSQGRAPSENSRLMKWAHRAIRDKLKMLAEEPFGIPVVEVIPAYSSRFHAANGQPGSRLHELQQLDSYQKRTLENLSKRSDKTPDIRIASSELLSQFSAVEEVNKLRIAAEKPPHTLFFPKPGGPLFLAAKNGSPVQADLNAATNLGLRAIAAPDCISILRRIRATKDGELFRPRTDNAREKAAFSKTDSIRMSGEPSKKFKASSSPNFFYESDGIATFDVAHLESYRLVSGVALWSTVNQAIFTRCAELNRERLKSWGHSVSVPSPSKAGIMKNEDPDDDIPL